MFTARQYIGSGQLSFFVYIKSLNSQTYTNIPVCEKQTEES